MRLRKDERALPAVRPNEGLRALYRRRMECLIDEMTRSVEHWMSAAYRANEPIMAQDAKIPASALRIAVNKLVRRWNKRFNEASSDLARYFAQSARRRSDDQLRMILKKGGFTVEFNMTPAMRDIMRATVDEQIGLIRSIPQQYFIQVRGAVMRSVQTGRDLGALSKEIEAMGVVTRKRAALIARDQNNKATASMNRARQVELGVNKAVWLHSHAGKKPRPTHLANDGRVYDPARGWFDPDPKVRRFIWPGELICCGCVSRSVIKGFS